MRERGRKLQLGEDAVRGAEATAPERGRGDKPVQESHSDGSATRGRRRRRSRIHRTRPAGAGEPIGRPCRRDEVRQQTWRRHPHRMERLPACCCFATWRHRRLPAVSSRTGGGGDEEPPATEGLGWPAVADEPAWLEVHRVDRGREVGDARDR